MKKQLLTHGPMTTSLLNDKVWPEEVKESGRLGRRGWLGWLLHKPPLSKTGFETPQPASLSLNSGAAHNIAMVA